MGGGFDDLRARSSNAGNCMPLSCIERRALSLHTRSELTSWLRVCRYRVEDRDDPYLRDFVDEWVKKVVNGGRHPEHAGEFKLMANGKH
jgi:hypothetical protein